MRLAALALLLLAGPAAAEEPFVDKPARLARALIYGLPMAGDAASTLWARSRGLAECHAWYQDRGVMLAGRVAIGSILAWLDGKLPRFWRWVLRGATVGAYGWQTWANIRAGRGVGSSP